ncbi:uncharacterized protein LOC108745098 [Agrilus planipennis]|uniref:Uncharacterized protein LOC108745098 n=1 Tax=Agrilus planipennis TaxID=224129 RepID=A0A1W4XV52_AGRPL|nr:uncharacterized protein LOC108745098 [Agrilus planipennis]
MVERFHRQLKAAIKCHGNPSWTETLPAVMLGIRAAWKDDLQSTIAEMVYGEPLRLPGEFITASQEPDANTQADFVQNLRRHTQLLRPTEGTRHGKKTPFVFKDLATTDLVFVRRDGPKGLLEQPYEGPFTVRRRSDKTFVVLIRGREVTVSIDRLKPAYLQQQSETPIQPNVVQNKQTHTRFGRRVHFPDRLQYT